VGRAGGDALQFRSPARWLAASQCPPSP